MNKEAPKVNIGLKNKDFKVYEAEGILGTLIC